MDDIETCLQGAATPEDAVDCAENGMGSCQMPDPADLQCLDDVCDCAAACLDEVDDCIDGA
jgi:hypothetical protein